MARRGTALVPTMINIRTFGGIAEQARAKFAGYADHMLALRDRFPAWCAAAHEAGVPIYVGTDAGGGIRHGLAAEEMLLLHEAGIPAADVLASASWRAREWLGFPGLVEGGLADLVVYAGGPARRTCGWSARRSGSCCAAASSADQSTRRVTDRGQVTAEPAVAAG